MCKCECSTRDNRDDRIEARRPPVGNRIGGAKRRVLSAARHGFPHLPSSPWRRGLSSRAATAGRPGSSRSNRRRVVVVPGVRKPSQAFQLECCLDSEWKDNSSFIFAKSNYDPRLTPSCLPMVLNHVSSQTIELNGLQTPDASRSFQSPSQDRKSSWACQLSAAGFLQWSREMVAAFEAWAGPACRLRDESQPSLSQ